MEERITDHAIMGIEINMDATGTHHVMERKNIKITNKMLFQKYLLEADWSWVNEIEVGTETTVDEDFDNVIQNCSDRATLLKSRRLEIIGVEV